MNSAYHRLKTSLEAIRQVRELAAVDAEHSAWKSANYDTGCVPTPGKMGTAYIFTAPPG